MVRAKTIAEPIVLPNTVKIKADAKPDIGFLGIALQTSFYELLHAKDFYSGMISVISRGGDVDTNAAITGSLLGALFGAENIPKEWIESVKNAAPVRKSLPNIRQKMNMTFITFDESLIKELYNL